MRINPGVIVTLPLVLLTAGCQQPAPDAPAVTATAENAVERGEYLVTVGGCHDCHTPKVAGPNGPEADMSRLLMGHPADDAVLDIPDGLVAPDGWGALVNSHLTAWVTPAGVAYAMNLTPDEETGIGSWTEQMFFDALKSGRHQGTGRAILPPMPWVWYRYMTDDDLRAVFAYLQSIPPIRNPIPEPLPPPGS